MQDSLEFLARAREHEQDVTLTTLVRFQLIGDEVHKLFTQDVIRGESGSQTPSYIFRKAMLERLRTFQETIPPCAASKRKNHVSSNIHLQLLTLWGVSRHCSTTRLCH